MHVAFLTSEYPHPSISHAAGIGTSIKNLAAALVKKDVKVTIFVYGQLKDEVFEDEGVVIHSIENKNFSFGKWYFYRKHINKYCETIIRKQKIDVIEAPDWTGITAFMKFSIPLIIRFHGSDTYFCHLEQRKQKWKNRWFETLAVKNAQGFIAPTDFAGNLSKKLFGLKNKRIKTIHYGLELDNFTNKNTNNFEKGLILYVGTIIRKKGVLELPAIFHEVRKKHPEARLVLIGGDSFDIKTKTASTWELLKGMFDKEDIKNVQYLGKIPYINVKEYIEKSNVCVFPTFAETLGMVTIESMAMQKPVVNSNYGWAQELIVDGKSGFLVDPKDYISFSAKISKVLKEETVRIEMGKEARKRVEEKFNIGSTANQCIEFYNECLVLIN